MPRDPFLRLAAPVQAQVGRRRRRRLVARYRRHALAAAAALLVAVSLRALSPVHSPPGEVAGGGTAAGAGAVPAVHVQEVPADRVLVTVVPAEAAVLGLAVPGSHVDLYAVSTWAAGTPEAARRVASAALVVQMPSTGPDPPGSPGAAPLPTAGPSVLALAVRDTEAELIASAQGQALTVAVLPGP